MDHGAFAEEAGEQNHQTHFQSKWYRMEGLARIQKGPSN